MINALLRNFAGTAFAVWLSLLIVGSDASYGSSRASFVGAAEPGSSAIYGVLPAEHKKPAPLRAVVATYLLQQEDQGPQRAVYIFDLRRNDQAGKEVTAVQIRLIGDCDSATNATQAKWLRYQIWIPATGEAYDFRNIHTDRALLPQWMDFSTQFLPRPTQAARQQSGWPETQRMLGHVLSLRSVRPASAILAPEEYKVLSLDPELLIGTGRTFKDQQNRKLPYPDGPSDYTYTPWTQTDYESMIDAGFNTFALVPGVEHWLRALPVFYRRNLKGDAPLDWPVDFYRSNFRGASMYADEPACVMLRDKDISDGLLHFSDAAEIIKSRAGLEYERLSTRLGLDLERAGVSLGQLELRQNDLAVWETRYETAFYQLEAGFAGFVHEGRYHLDRFYESPHTFDEYVRTSTGLERRHTAADLLKIHYAILRGAARHWRKDWGTSIYGQADSKIAPLAFRLAYDMGARYLWFWTSDLYHHVPWSEQLELARGIRAHAKLHPRQSMGGARPLVDRLILIPYGYFLVLESPMKRRHHWDLWWVRDLDSAGINPASQAYRQLMRAVFTHVHEALDRGESFDISVDNGQVPSGYRSVIRIGIDGGQ